MEGSYRVEISPLPYILDARSIQEEVQSWPGITTATTVEGNSFLFSKKKLNPEDEEFDRVPILVRESLTLMPMQPRKIKKQLP